jgi:hypothetical protein
MVSLQRSHLDMHCTSFAGCCQTEHWDSGNTQATQPQQPNCYRACVQQD